MTDIFEKVKDQVKIADAVEAFGIKLNSRDKGLCPFHREKLRRFRLTARTTSSLALAAEKRVTS